MAHAGESEYPNGKLPELQAVKDGKPEAHMDVITVTRLSEAVSAGDLASVQSMLGARPELVHMDMAEDDEHRALHYAVLHRRPQMVRLLMQLARLSPGHLASPGCHARSRLPPTWLPTTRRHHPSERCGSVAKTRLLNAGACDSWPLFTAATIMRLSCSFAAAPLSPPPQSADWMTALHWAAANLWKQLGAWLLERGANAQARTAAGHTVLDVVGCGCPAGIPDRSRRVARFAEMVLAHDGERTARWAIATGDTDWLRARHRKAPGV